MPPFKVVEVDIAGAGGVYNAASVHGLLKGWLLSRTMELASAAGAVKVTKFGPMSGPSSMSELRSSSERLIRIHFSWESSEPRILLDHYVPEQYH